jgi:methyltransferase (TIGR00027 family)
LRGSGLLKFGISVPANRGQNSARVKQSSASSTALTIAAAMSYLARTTIGEQQPPPEASTLGDWLLEHHSPLTRLLLRSFDRSWGRRFAGFLESVSVPGIIAHYLARKRAIEVLAREAGAPQLAVLGAGFDTLALRVAAQHSGRSVWELDHPATQAWKIRAIEATGLRSPNLQFLARDFSLPKGRALFEPGNQSPTFWVAEGLLMYFPETEVKGFFQTIHRVSKPGSRFAFTYMEPREDGRVDFVRRSRPLHLWLKTQKEPFQWGIRREKLPGFLAALGFRMLPSSPEITKEIDLLHVGEYLALAEIPTS